MNPLQTGIISGTISGVCFQDLSIGVCFSFASLMSVQSIVLVAKKSFKERKSYADSMKELFIRTTFFFTLSIGVLFSRSSFSVERELFVLIFAALHVGAVFFIAKHIFERSIAFGKIVEPFRNWLEKIEEKIQVKPNTLAIDKNYRLQSLRSYKENLFNLSPYSKTAILDFLEKNKATFNSLEEWADNAG